MTYYAKQVENGVFIPATESKYTALLADWEETQPEPEEAPGAWERVA